MTGPSLEAQVRETLLRAQDDAPLVPDLLAGVVQRRRTHRRVVAGCVLAAVATAAGIAVPAALSLSATRSASHAPPITSTGQRQHPVATALGQRTGRWPTPAVTTVQAVVVADHAFEVQQEQPGTIIRFGDDGVRKLMVTSGLHNPLQLTANSYAVYATDSSPDIGGDPGPWHVWRIDPATLTVAASVTLREQPQNFVATDSGIYWLAYNVVHRLDPTSLTSAGIYRVRMTRDSSLDDLFVDGTGVSVLINAGNNTDVWLQHLDAALTPGLKTKIPFGLDAVGSGCGLSFVQRHDGGSQNKSTVTLSGADAAAKPFTVLGNIDSLAVDCAGGVPGYATINDRSSSVVVPLRRTGPHTYSVGRALALPPGDEDPSLVLSGGDLWVIGRQFVDRIHPTNP